MSDDAESGRFACAKCDGLFVHANFYRMSYGKICYDCLQKEHKENYKKLKALGVGNRFRLMFGQPLLPQSQASHE